MERTSRGMDNRSMAFEREHFMRIEKIIEEKIQQGHEQLRETRDELQETRRDMWENAAHFSTDFDKMVELNQHLTELSVQDASTRASENSLAQLQRMQMQPYFARVDFIAEGEPAENIYIGLGALMDELTYEMYVYDWRAPIASLFYRYDLGPASFSAPKGSVHGEITLKRQYEIKNGKLEYFYDASLQFTDDLLKRMLSQNASPKMRAIVRTIQKEQDRIIREMDSDLLIVQGVAGSGKTSVALHRVAFLLYEGLSERLSSEDILLLSPNELFSTYIEGVLPELGERNIHTPTFESIFRQCLGSRRKVRSRMEELEAILCCEDTSLKTRLQSAAAFKGSVPFMHILERGVKRYAQSIEYIDIYYDDALLMGAEEMRAHMQRRSARLPLAARLHGLRTAILDRLHAARPARLQKLQRMVAEDPEHQFEIKQVARLRSVRESLEVLQQVESFTQVDVYTLYSQLVQLLKTENSLCKGLSLPSDFQQILEDTQQNLQSQTLKQEDALALLYLHLLVEGTRGDAKIRQVVVDEMQDYRPIHFGVLKKLYPSAKYTLLGDAQQSLDQVAGESFARDIQRVLGKKKVADAKLNKSFRCTQQILDFSSKFLDASQGIERFNRQGEAPIVCAYADSLSMDEGVEQQLLAWKDQDYGSAAVVCKSARQAQAVFNRLKKRLPELKLVREKEATDLQGILVIPLALAKGLEFDCVLVYGVDHRNYPGMQDKRLLYVACTRALHRLALCYAGEPSALLREH